MQAHHLVDLAPQLRDRVRCRDRDRDREPGRLTSLDPADRGSHRRARRYAVIDEDHALTADLWLRPIHAQHVDEATELLQRATCDAQDLRARDPELAYHRAIEEHRHAIVELTTSANEATEAAAEADAEYFVVVDPRADGPIEVLALVAASDLAKAVQLQKLSSRIPPETAAHAAS